MSIELKIKSKHLSEEAKIIRFEENKLLKQVAYNRRKHHETGSNDEYKLWSDPAFSKYVSLNSHRKFDVRNENRATYLARAYLAGVPYKSVESKRKEDTEWIFINKVFPRFRDMVIKYGKTLPSDKRIWDNQKQKCVASVYFEQELKEWAEIK